MNLLDYIIIGVLLISVLTGFKKGLISSIVTFIGTLLVIILAFYLKNPVSAFLYEHMPFIDLGGKLAGMNIFNILIYEGASYLITLVILSFIMGIIIKLSGIFDKLVKATVILSLPSKLLGAICGLVEGAILAFIIVFIISLVAPTSNLYGDSSYADTLLSKTPILGNMMENTHKSIIEVYEIAKNNEQVNNKNEANLESLNVLLKYEILSVESAENLVADGKIDIPGASEIINKYKKGV